MPAQDSAFSRSYNSFSGVDIKAVSGENVLAELQAISYSITREKAPLYTMGSADPRSYSRGKRGIAGTLIFLMFDRHALLSIMKDRRFLSDKDDIRPLDAGGGNATDTVAGPGLGAVNQRPVGATVDAQESALTSVGSDQEPAAPWYVDQIPPFDITLAAANEYGAMAVMRIYGVELLNEGYGISIDDIMSEHQMTYVARTISPWLPLPPVDGSPVTTTA